MRKIFLSLLVVLVMSSLVWAKDGPFPMILGEWRSVDQNMQIQISFSHYDAEKQAVLLVIARTAEIDRSKQKLIGSGLVTYNLNEGRLVVEIRNDRDQKTEIILVPEFKDTDTGHQKLELKMTVMPAIDEKNVPSSLVRVLNND